MDLTSATRPKTLTLLYLSEFLIDFYRIFRDLRFFSPDWFILKISRKYFLRMRSVFNFGHSEKKAKINLIDSNLERTVLTSLYLALDIFLHFNIWCKLQQNAQNEKLNQFLSNVSNFGHSGKRPKTLNLLYLIEFLTDLYEIFRDDSFWVTKSVYHKKIEKSILRMRSVLYLRMRSLKRAKRF